MYKTLLVVDDSKSIRTLVCNCLDDAGYKVIRAVNGQDGLEKLTNDVKLVVTDLNMPVMDGINMVKNIRKNTDYKHLPIVMLTTEYEPEKRNAARAAGTNAWMNKPFEIERLLGVVKKFVR
jgi:two-component system, chemotaxis family, chemotaxis protein CheY